MKTSVKILSALVLAALVAVSCDPEKSTLDTSSPSTFDDEVVYSNYDLAEGTIFGILACMGEVNSYRGRFLPWYGFNTDIEWYNSYTNDKPYDNKNEIASYGIKTNNTQLNLSNGPFPLMYQSIERANLAIEGLRKYGNGSTQYLLGEALTLRAMIYYDLIKAWGDVPARFEPVTNETIYLPKSSRDVIFKQILADLDEAIPYLPYPGQTPQTSRTDRVNKVFAEGLYARIALFAAGYALRPDDNKIGTGDFGIKRLSNDEALKASVLYPKALAHLQDAIGRAGLEDFETYWRNFNNQDNMTAGPKLETLFVIPFGSNRGRWNYTFAIKNEGAMINGYTFSQGGIAGPVPSFYFKYDDGDVRKDITCVNYSWTKDGSIEPSGIAKWYFGKYRFEWMDKYPYGGGNDDGIKPVVMRYADILLMAAEIENELNGPSDFAKDCFYEVRARACGETAAETYVNTISASKETFFNAIVDERAFEFCGEFLRKADLIRWNMLGSKMMDAKADMYDLRSKSGDYAFLAANGGDIYYSVADDEESLVIWGLKPSDTVVPVGDQWTKVAGYVKYSDDAKKPEGLYTNKVDNLYINNPDEYMFWPLFDQQVSNSQGTLVNDYQYAQ